MALETTGDTGGSSAPIGTELAGTTSNTPAAPTVYQVDDDTLIQPKGIDKPVKYGEHVRGLQSEFTRAKQQAAQVQRELEQERQLRQRYEAERQRQAQQQKQGQQNDVYESLRSLPYLSGEDAVGVVQQIGQQIQQRDRILMTALQELKSLKEIVGGLHSSSTNASFDAKINKWLSDGGYPAEAAELAKDIYMAYDGDDLDQEFPAIFKQRWEQVQRMIEAQRTAALNRNRQNPFVPGKGGAGRPSAPLQFTGKEDPKEVAERLWTAMNGPGT
jgi:hypothetical protein